MIGLIIGIVVGVIAFLWVIILLIVLKIRNEKYKVFVMENSAFLKDLERMNNKYDFIDFEDNKYFHHRYDNKSHWLKTEPASYLALEVRNNLPYWIRLKDYIIKNRSLKSEYEKEIEEYFIPISKEVCLASKKKYEKCVEVEGELYRNMIIKPKTNIKIRVNLQYVSPKERVNLSKDDYFDYDRLVQIIDSVSPTRVDRETYEKLAGAERSMLSNSMRYDVLRRDGFKCVLCGMSRQDGVILHVDHIIPIAKGGKTEMSNLRTLCERCNLGKSDKIE